MGREVKYENFNLVLWQGCLILLLPKEVLWVSHSNSFWDGSLSPRDNFVQAADKKENAWKTISFSEEWL